MNYCQIQAFIKSINLICSKFSYWGDIITLSQHQVWNIFLVSIGNDV